MARKKKAAGGNPWPERLRKLRTDRWQVTQAEAARRVSVTTRTWVNWEMGHFVPSPIATVLLEILISQAEQE